MTPQDRDLLERTFLRELAGIFYHDFANTLTVLKTKTAVMKRKLGTPPTGAEEVPPFLENLQGITDRMNKFLLTFRNRDPDLAQTELASPTQLSALLKTSQDDFISFFPDGTSIPWLSCPEETKVMAAPRRVRVAFLILGLGLLSSPQSSWSINLTDQSVVILCRGLSCFLGFDLFHSKGHPLLELAIVKKIVDAMGGQVNAQFSDKGCETLEIHLPIVPA